MIKAMLTTCVTIIAPLVALEESRRIWALVRARKAEVRSHLFCTTPSAPWVLMVSSEVRLSTSDALRSAAAR